MKRNLVICLMGPTASGKTQLAADLLAYFPFEIISIDSAMIYRGMNIGTAKPDAAFLAKAPHHLIDILNPPESYSAAQCCADVNLLCEAIHRRGNIPLLVGGTMMYFHALQAGLSTLPESDPLIRARLNLALETNGLLPLYQRLQHCDPTYASKIHANDQQRILRALEVYELTQQPMSSLLGQTSPQAYDYVSLRLMPQQRAWLHERIDRRFNLMINQGLVDEVAHLIETWALSPHHPAMRAVGYRQVLGYLQGEYDKKTMMDKGMAATRQLAKRQLTWLRHWPTGMAFDAEAANTLDTLATWLNRLGPEVISLS